MFLSLLLPIPQSDKATSSIISQAYHTPSHFRSHNRSSSAGSTASKVRDDSVDINSSRHSYNANDISQLAKYYQ